MVVAGLAMSVFTSAEISVPGFAETLVGETVTLRLKAGPVMPDAEVTSVRRDTPRAYAYLVVTSAAELPGAVAAWAASDGIPVWEIARLHASDHRTVDERLAVGRDGYLTGQDPA
jgi:hypothetical protein